MKRSGGIVTLTAVLASLLCAALPGRALAADGTVRGRFVKLAERRVGEREYLAVLVQPGEGKDEVVLLMPRGTDLAAVARKLRKGQLVEITYVTKAGQKWVKRIGAEVKANAVRGRFVKLAERRVGEREYLAVVVQPREGKDGVVLLMPRGTDLAAVARKLRKGQLVEIAYLTKAGQKWVKRIGAERAEGAGLREEIAKLRQRLEQMERELKALRKENALLRKKLREPAPAKKRAAEKPKADTQADLL